MDANVGRGVARCGRDREGLDLLLGRAQRLRKTIGFHKPRIPARVPYMFDESASVHVIAGAPAIFPYYVTGALTTSGGSWNAAAVAEYVKWGDDTVSAHGIGDYIAKATTDGDYPKIVLGVAVMSIFVIMFNRLLWHLLYVLAEKRLRLD
jgi:Binding-protein-dependent transport system inner membrane component